MNTCILSVYWIDWRCKGISPPGSESYDSYAPICTHFYLLERIRKRNSPIICSSLYIFNTEQGLLIDLTPNCTTKTAIYHLYTVSYYTVTCSIIASFAQRIYVNKSQPVFLSLYCARLYGDLPRLYALRLLSTNPGYTFRTLRFLSISTK